jgi:TPR repeat protein
MGLLGNLLSGGAGFAGANNAHLAELVIKRLTASEKKRVAEKVVEMGMSAGGHRKTTEQFKDFFNDHERLCQLNVIALALAHLDIDPNVAGESWMLVNHPFALPTDSNDLQANARHFRRKHNLTVSVGTEKINIRNWAEFGEPAKSYSDRNYGKLPPKFLTDNEAFVPPVTLGTELQQINALAEQGDAVAQLGLGSMYALGQGVPQDYAQAYKWYLKAADQRNAGAQFCLGDMYLCGQGVLQDNARATMWFRKAADQGFAAAQHNLGMMYVNGRGVPQDYAQAVMWLRKAAEQGDAGAQANLGNMYATGLGMTQDDAQAMMWFRRAAEQGKAEAQCNLGGMYYEGQDYVQAMMWYFIAKASGTTIANESLQELEPLTTPVQIAEAQRMAREWQAAHHPTN